ncbi:MAG: hypothetical protein ACRYFE_06255 [Janthinobacterium lividum]
MFRTMAFVASLSLLTSPALACIPEAPAPLENLFSEDGPPSAVVRVVRMERAEEPKVTEFFKSWNYTATVRPIVALKGAPKRDYDIVLVGDYIRLKDGPMFCPDRMNINVGDVVFGFERPDGSLRTYPLSVLAGEYRDRVPSAYQYLFEPRQ